MIQMKNYVCWLEENTLNVSPRDAASLTDAMFQAVHHPLPITKRRIESHNAGERISESDLAEFIQGRLRPDGYLLVPIVGSSGTGKSHLVRWLHVNTSNTKGWECRYLPKNDTGLRRTISTIIRDSDNPKLIEIRETLESSSTSDEKEEIVSQRLLDELAILISDFDNLPVAKTVSSDTKVVEHKDHLIKVLPDLFHDPVAREAMTRSGAVIPRLVKLAISGRRADDGLDDDAAIFSEIDLPLSTSAIVGATSKVQKLLSNLKALPKLLDVAIALINLVLPEACKRISISNKVDLVEVFRIVRREMAKSNKELVLFVEDLTVLHGVEQEFLDAIIEPVNHPDGRLCNLRVIFAITEGHFDNLDTVRTRCEDAFWLDIQYGEQGIGTNDIVNFLGRYLNVTRLNAASVESAWRDKRYGDWLPNACSNCIHIDNCHETFGKSDQSFGIYPFTNVAIHKFVEALSEARFDPRNIVRQLIFSFLNQSKVEINTDQFPSEEILRPYSSIERLDPLLESEIRSQTSTNEIGNRLVNFTRFWIDESSPGDTYSAFNLPFIQLDHKDKIPTSIYVRETSRYREGSEIKSNITKKDSSKLFRAISDWSTKDTPLKMDQVNQLRKLISKLIFTNIKFSLLPYNDQKTINAKSIEERIKFQGTANASNVKNSVIEIEKSSESALVLQAIVIGDENLYGDFDESELETYHSALSRAIDKWIDKIEILLTKERIDTLEDRFIRLIEMQVAFGTIRDTDSPDEILTKLFIQESRFENPVGTGEAMSVSKWTKYMIQAKSKIKDIQDKVRNEFGEGRTVPKLFEVGLVHPVIERFHRETRPNADVAANSIRISKEFSEAIEDTWSQLPEIIGFINSEIDPETEWHLQSEKICETTNLAFSMSLINSKDTEKFNRLKYLSGVTQKFEIQGYAGMHGKLESKEANWLQKASLLSKIDLVLLQAVNEFIKVGIELTQMIEERIGVLAEGSARENTNQLALDNLLRGLCDLEEKLGD